MMSAKYFEYYTIILGGGVFSWTHCSPNAINIFCRHCGQKTTIYCRRL